MINSFDEQLTISILRERGINPNKWDKIIHTGADKIVLYKTVNGNREIQTIDLKTKVEELSEKIGEELLISEKTFEKITNENDMDATKLNEAVAQLNTLVGEYNEKKSYKTYGAIRKTLQEVKSEAQNLRVEVLEDFKTKE
ncbi:MAG: hypothetical protein WC755_08800 [Candidatus Woesearchaeota archaeon]|jgi:hypothetical protein